MNFSRIVVNIGVLVASLLLIGVISGTVVRHVVQVIPPVVVLIAALMGRRWSRQAALPIFLHWLLIMGAVWLTITGIAPVAPGSYSSTEILLTMVIAIACLTGGYTSIRMCGQLSMWVGMFALFGALQVLALWVSFMELFAYD